MSNAAATGGLSEEEEDAIWANSVEVWKKEKEERRISNEKLVEQGLKPVDYDNDWKDLPIFMQELPTDESSNQYLAAFQSIAADCTPEERAETFKTLGNDFFKEGKARYHDAIFYYTKALSIKCDDMKKNSIYLSNRAAVNMELGNYGKVVKDCTISIEFNQGNMKAHFRLARALYSLQRFDKSLIACNAGLLVDPENKDLLTFKETVTKRIESIKKQEQDKIDKENQKLQEVTQLANQLYEKKYKLGNRLFDMSQYTYQSDRKITIDQSNGDVHFPVVFLYPEFAKSDFIMDFQEDHSFLDHLSMMFPPGAEFAPWDSKKEYSIDKIEVYFETNWTKPILPNIKTTTEKKWIRVKHTTNISAVVSHPTYIIPEIPIFYIVSRGNNFYRKFLENKV